MKKEIVFLLLVFACFISISSCQGNKEGRVSDSLEPSSVISTQTNKESFMVASVNNTIITQKDMDRELENLIREFGDKVPPDQMVQVRSMLKKQALQNLINQILLVQKADEEDIKPQEKRIDDKLAEISGLFSTPEQFQQQLDAAGLSKEGLRKQIEQSLKIETLLQKPTSTIKQATNEEIKNFFDQNPQNFQMQEQIRASHILISFDKEESKEQRAEKRTQLANLKKEIENGADFSALAVQNSTCPSKAKGGDLGFFERGKMVRAFEDEAFKLKIGEVSDIVETQFGYHLIKVTDHKDAQAIPLEQVKDKVAKHLNEQKKRQVITEYLNELRSDAKIEYFEAEEAK